MSVINKNSKSIYPLNLDAKLSREDGRCAKKENSVNNPNLDEMAKNMQFIGVPFGIEPNKRHPQDFFRFGRIKFQLKDETGQFYNKDIKNKTHLANKLGALLLANVQREDPAKSQTKQGSKKQNKGKE